jgi:hypothetical protein
MHPASEALGREENGRVVVGSGLCSARRRHRGGFFPRGDLPVDFAVAPAFGHEERVEGTVEAVHAHPHRHRERLGLAGHAEAHAVAHVAKFRARASPASVPPSMRRRRCCRPRLPCGVIAQRAGGFVILEVEMQLQAGIGFNFVLCACQRSNCERSDKAVRALISFSDAKLDAFAARVAIRPRRPSPGLL